MNNFKYNKSNNGISYYSIPHFDNTELVKTCFTTRLGGISRGSFSSLNLGLKTNDNKESVLENYKRICNELGISLDDLVFSDQVHGDRIRVVSKADTGKLFEDNPIKDVDGLITNEKGVALITFYADCVPIYILDPINEVIALVHGGWRGTVSRIASKAVSMMIEKFDTKPRDCLAAIGPSIGKCCFEVGENVVEKFNKEFTNLESSVISKDNSKFLIDLWHVNKIDLKEIGLLERNITCSHVCTVCNKDILFSYRGENGNCGRMVAILQLI